MADSEASLAAMRVSSVHCYVLHRDDPATHPAEIARTLAALVDRGYADTVGVSNWTPERIVQLMRELHLIDGPRLAVVSNYGGLAVPTAPTRWPGVRSSTPDLLDLAHTAGFRIFGWSALSAGYFTDDRFRPEFAGAENLRRRSALWESAADAGVTPVEVLIRALATVDSAFVPVVSTRNPDRLRLLCAAAAAPALDDAVARFRHALRAVDAPTPSW